METLELPRPMRGWTTSVLALAAAALLPRMLLQLLTRVQERFSDRMPQVLCILLDGFARPVALMLRVLLIAVALLALPERPQQLWPVAAKLMQTLLVLTACWGGWRCAPICHLLLRSAGNHLYVETSQTLVRFFENIFRTLIVMLGGIMTLDLFGVPVSGLLTGASVAGLAVSLAAQSTLSNLIAGVTLVLEHPFGIGDYVVLGQHEGTVEDISFRSTRIRTLDNALITVENATVCSEYIQNVTNRSSRLWEFTIGLTYDTPTDRVQTLCDDLNALLLSSSHVKEAQVFLAGFSDSSIDVKARVYVDTLPLRAFNRLKGEMNLQIMSLMQRDGCEFAFPSASVYLERRDGEAAD